MPHTRPAHEEAGAPGNDISQSSALEEGTRLFNRTRLFDGQTTPDKPAPSSSDSTATSLMHTHDRGGASSAPHLKGLAHKNGGRVPDEHHVVLDPAATKTAR